MLLLQLQVSDTYSYDGTSLQVVGVFTNMDMVKKMLFAEHAGMITEHLEPKGCNCGRFTVKYYDGNYLVNPDRYVYDIVELDKKI